MLSTDIHVFHPLKSAAFSASDTHMHDLESIFWQAESTTLQHLSYLKMDDGLRAYLNTQIASCIDFLISPILLRSLESSYDIHMITHISLAFLSFFVVLVVLFIFFSIHLLRKRPCVELSVSVI